MTQFIPTTKLQRQTKAVFDSDEPFQIVLKDNEVNGIVINKATAKALLETNILAQIEEELWEAQDETTQKLINNSRSGRKSDSIELKAFRKKHVL